ncbi:MAG TPA: mechanosensitive ion channel domain-containing protein [Pseudolabrys sp.]
MTRFTLALTILVLSIAVQARPAHAQDATQRPEQAVTQDQARQALDVLRDDTKRTQMIQTLETIAQVPQPGKLKPPQPAPPENLGVQLLAQVSDSLNHLSREIAAAARTVSDLPRIGRWLTQLAGNPDARVALFDIAWKFALVLGCALAVEWIVRRLARKQMLLIARYAPSRIPPSIVDDAATVPPADNGIWPDDRPAGLPRWQYLWSLLTRLPFVLGRLILDILPVICFAAVGNLLLATQIGEETVPRLIILAVVNAYVLCRIILLAAAAIISPGDNQPSLFLLRDETASYIGVWMKRVVVVTVFGVLLANVALLLGLDRQAYLAVLRLVMLVVHLLLVVVILQCRRIVADFIRAPHGRTGIIAVVRNRLADVWHIPAIVVDMALWAVWALEIQNGYTLLVQYFLATIAVLLIARGISMAATTGLDRLFRISPDMTRRYPGLEVRANRYLPALRLTISWVIAAITILALLEVWGIDAVEWFARGQIGPRLISTVMTSVIAGLAALLVWEASNAAIDRHLAQLSREGRYAKMARLRTVLPMLRTTLLSLILTVVLLTLLSELGINIAPLLAGAGIVGIAIGFGAQKLVQDVITGIFLLLENAMQVGDFVTVSGLSGTVENLSIRSIRLRASDGSIHIVPFSSVTSVTNTNRGIGNAAISVSVAYKEDTDRVSAVLKEIAEQMRAEKHFAPMIRGDLDLWGVDKVDASMTTIVGQIVCTDAGRWPVQREFYRRMKKRFDELGIEIARPGQTMLILSGAAARPVNEALAAAGAPSPVR